MDVNLIIILINVLITLVNVGFLGLSLKLYTEFCKVRLHDQRDGNKE